MPLVPYSNRSGDPPATQYCGQTTATGRTGEPGNPGEIGSGIAPASTIPAGSYPICNPALSNTPCVGVLGGFHESQVCAAGDTGCVDYKYGASSTVMDRLRKKGTGKDFVDTCGTTPVNLGALDGTGACVPCDSTNCVSADLISSGPLNLNDAALNAASSNPKDPSWSTFPMQALHKIWGDGGNVTNNGTNARNVYVSSSPSPVKCVDELSAYNTVAKTLDLQVHGRLYKGTVKGVAKTCKIANPNSATDAVMPKCQGYAQIAPSDRVGGVAVTRQSYGPGVYNVLAYVPPTEDKKIDGRGYVFAIWPFHYEEIYSKAGVQSQARGSLVGPLGDPDYPCYGNCDWDSIPSCTCPGASDQSCNKTGEGDVDLFDSITHEIDIEIPSNSNCSPSGSPDDAATIDWKKYLTWDTMNVNSWVNDINNYDLGSGAYYTNIGNRNKGSKDFISTDGRYHWYTIDWHVDNDDYTQNYVAVYFDSPFDPTGKATYAGKPLPTAPDPSKLVAKTSRFVPTRFGRLNVGGWFGWWGYDKSDPESPAFDTATIKIANVNISPYEGTGFLFPQSYDQRYVTKEGKTATIACDFVDMYSQGLPDPNPNPCPPGPCPPPTPCPPPGPCSPTNKLWTPLSISFLVVACALLIALIGVAVKLGLLEKKR